MLTSWCARLAALRGWWADLAAAGLGLLAALSLPPLHLLPLLQRDGNFQKRPMVEPDAAEAEDEAEHCAPEPDPSVGFAQPARERGVKEVHVQVHSRRRL